jgi:hypothetical protein
LGSIFKTGFVEVAATDNTDGTRSLYIYWCYHWYSNRICLEVYNGANPSGVKENLKVPLLIKASKMISLLENRQKNTNFFSFCNRIAAGPHLLHFNSFRKPGVVYAETTVISTGVGQFHYIR